MKSFKSACAVAAKAAGAAFVSSFFSGVLAAQVSGAPPGASGQPSLSSQETQNAAGTEVKIAKTQSEWHESLLELERPKAGCYASSFPRVEWKPIGCKTPPPYPITPARGRARISTVGGGLGNDFAAHVTAIINSAEGAFLSVTGGTTESGLVGNVGAPVANAYTLQLNTNVFASAACAGSPNPNCVGWEQFVYENNATARDAFIQYWLIDYNTGCPGGWYRYSPGGSTIDCYRNSPGAASLPGGQPVSNLPSVTLTGTAAAGSDGVTVAAGGSAVFTAGNNAVNAAAGWTDAEFNVFGDGSSGQANFSANSTIVVKTTVHNGTRNAPTCSAESFTGETNNLTLVGTPSIPTLASPGVEFTESNVPGTVASCAAAAGVGDTHLNTFSNMLFDFQATGDFLLAETTPDFIVQSRQVSGPQWPNVSVNEAVAVRTGKSKVIICLPDRLGINGQPVVLGDGQSRPLPDGVEVSRRGNTYVVTDQSGNSLRAEINGKHPNDYINVSVGLGQWPTKVIGLLANSNGNPNRVQDREGEVLKVPFTFDELYRCYAASWRVPPGQSLLMFCGEEPHPNIPSKLFFAKDLDPATYKHNLAVCARSGVKDTALLEACALDIEVLHTDSAAGVFAGARTPAVVGDPPH